MNICIRCSKEIAPSIDGSSTGYAVDSDNNKVCYTCCASQDLEYMRKEGDITLYMTTKEGKTEITNWPGSLRFSAPYVKKSWHNIASTRYDTWFVLDGFYWHAVRYGNNADIAHCKRTKQRLNR